jgi:DNA primase
MRVLDKDVLRAELPLAYACDKLGIVPDDSGQAICPFHDDHHPSMYFYVDDRGVEKWACPPCGKGGDLYDLIKEAEGLGFSDCLQWAADLLDSLPEGAVRQRRARPKPQFDQAAATSLLRDSFQRAEDNRGYVCLALDLLPKDSTADLRGRCDDWLAQTWGLGVGEDGQTVFPHYDARGALVGMKFRALDGTKWSYPGSSWQSLYGVWRPRRHQGLLVCEGETDAIWASMQSPPVDVMALPGGAGKFVPAWADYPADVLFLGFDGDEAGDEATKAWLKALAGRGRDVRVVPVRREEDLRSDGRPLDTLLRAASRYVGAA